LAVLEEVEAAMPELPPAVLADSRTMMSAYLVPAFLRQGQWGRAARVLARAYLANPLWFVNPLLRTMHGQYLDALAATAMKLVKGEPLLPHLSETTFEGGRPFGYLARQTDRAAAARPTPKPAPAAAAAR
jgi:hypothetical protein